MRVTVGSTHQRERRLHFPSHGTSLGATLTLPLGTGPFPGAVLLSGSGPLDRDSNVRRMRLDVSRQLADALAQAGVASVRYDKRGVGESPGDWRAAGLFDNVDDAEAAVAWLRAQAEVEADKVVVIGHSEGAVLATALAGRGAPVAGLVLLAGAARTGEEVLLWQARAIAPTLPAPVRLLLRLLRVDVVRKVATNHAKLKATTTDVARVGGARTNARWFREFLAYDPAADLERIAALVPGRVETLLVPDLTHSLRRQHGAPALQRYREEVRRPVDEDVVTSVTRWCRSTLAPSRATSPDSGRAAPGADVRTRGPVAGGADP